MEKKKNANKMRLLVQRCTREGHENCLDFYLAWYYEDKAYAVRIKPSFSNNQKLLYANAEKVPDNEPIVKYI